MKLGASGASASPSCMAWRKAASMLAAAQSWPSLCPASKPSSCPFLYMCTHGKGGEHDREGKELADHRSSVFRKSACSPSTRDVERPRAEVEAPSPGENCLWGCRPGRE